MSHGSMMSTPPVGFDGRPFQAARFTYGMMLGADDLNVGFDNARGQQQIASAWQQGGGVIWGYEVSRSGGEIVIGPGLAVDGVGRFVSNRYERQCISVGAWYDAEGRGRLGISESVKSPTFNLLVVARYATCSLAPVPVVAATCSTSAGPSDVADSRVTEQAALSLVAGTVPSVAARFPRLRLLAGYPDVGADTDALADVAQLGVPTTPDALAERFQALAAEDSAKLRPAALPESSQGLSDFPGRDADFVVLARVTGITLTGKPGNWQMTTGHVDHSARRTLVDTGTLQELLAILVDHPALKATQVAVVDEPCAMDDSDDDADEVNPLATAAAEAAAPPLRHRAAGPRIIRDSAHFEADTITIRTDGLVRADTFVEAAISLTALCDDGWQPVELGTPSAAGDLLTIPFSAVPDARSLRLIIMGRGRRPVMGSGPDGVLAPLAGADDDSPGSRHQGVDFVHIQEC